MIFYKVNSFYNMVNMFSMSWFNQDISRWKINKNCDTTDMFNAAIVIDEYKPKSLQK